LTLSGSLFLGGTGSANELSDYEEGTFNATFSFTIGNTGVTHSNTFGTYVKTGKLVVCSFDVQLSALGSGSGNARITGLPFAASSTTGVYGAYLPSYWQNMTGLPGEAYTHAIDSGTTLIQLRYATTTTSSQITNTHFTNTSRTVGIATYLTDA